MPSHAFPLQVAVLSVCLIFVGCTQEPALVIEVAAPAVEPVAIERPHFSIDTEAAFDAGELPAYSGSHDAAYEYIDVNIDAHVKELQRWMRQPSISAQNVGIREMAELVRQDFVDLGFQEAELVETDGHPGVWGYYDAGAEKTLVVYMMYDVQPVIPADWESPPFEANIVELELGRAIMARGATNQKGPQRAFLNAVQSIIAADGKLPVNLMITAEGEEELGSPNYPQIIDRYEQRLKTADGVLFPMFGQNPAGDTTMILGVKGIVYFEVEARGGDWGGPTAAEIHGSYKVLVDSPVWRLTQALASMTSEDGNTVLVPGFYDGIRPPTEEEQTLINGLAETRDDALIQKVFQVDRWIDDLSGRDAIVESLYQPTLNIDGIWGGYTEAGVKTILPHKATAKMDARLPVGLDPDEQLANIRSHLDAQGFSDITLRKLSGYPAAQTSVDTELVQAAIQVVNKYGKPPTVNPRITGSAPFYQFTERLGLPMLPAGLGHGSGAHAPNEYIIVESNEDSRIAGLAEIEKAYVDLLYALAD
jgi:acetylornithine deacetylase/succinyl-diaminopimelate desuccinylase-like protein